MRFPNRPDSAAAADVTWQNFDNYDIWGLDVATVDPGAATQLATDAVVFDPFVPGDDPFPTYRRLRDEAPLYRSAKWGFYALSRFEDVQAAARDAETFASGLGVALDETYKLFEPAGNLVSTDPPDHTRIRNAVRREFGLTTVTANLEAMVRRTTRELLAAMDGAGEVDLATGLATALPGAVVCTWLGFPKSDHAQLLEWFEDMNERVPGQLQLPPSALAARDAMRAYVKTAADTRWRQDQPDLLTALVRAQVAGEIGYEELVTMALLMFFAGIVTTRGLISTSLYHLAQRPTDRERLRTNPSAIPDAVEEFLRFDAPLTGTARTTSREVERHGQVIPAGAKVILIWASANRDERRWEEPDVLDLTRPRRRHVAFAEGIHHCLGAPLARLEGAIAIEEILRAAPDWESRGRPQRLFSAHDRVLERLPVSIRWA